MTVKRCSMSLILLLLLVGNIWGQDATQPLIILTAGDVWEWTGGPMLRQKTQWGYNGGIVMSPLNTEVAYASVSSEAIENPDPGAGTSLATNIWVITTDSTDNAYRPADQLAGAEALLRSQPMWSPDGTHLAWTEIGVTSEGTDVYTLVIYDKSTQTSWPIASGLPAQYGRGATLDGVWTDKGIVLFSHTYDPESVDGLTTYIVLDPVTGERKFDIPAASLVMNDDRLVPKMALPVQYEGVTWLGVLYSGEKTASIWQLIDLDIGQIEGETGVITGAVAEYEETSLRVIPRMRDDTPFPYYVIQDANGSLLNLSNDPLRVVARFALSPDGQAVAYQMLEIVTNRVESAVYVWRNGVVSLVPQIENPTNMFELAWGTVTWEISGEE